MSHSLGCSSAFFGVSFLRVSLLSIYLTGCSLLAVDLINFIQQPPAKGTLSLSKRKPA